MTNMFITESKSLPKYHFESSVEQMTCERIIEAQVSFRMQNPGGPRISHTIQPTEVLSVKERMSYISNEIIKVRQKI
jgi:hypothetical protein